ncbi:hypothetical protein GRJ2_001541200 [Grus japonensis]|uniref:Uncharacterized protein n=1 Tax=Grus japonensis TaxID=30415 RepID=A0ABC9WZG8_GRUJA
MVPSPHAEEAEACIAEIAQSSVMEEETNRELLTHLKTVITYTPTSLRHYSHQVISKLSWVNTSGERPHACFVSLFWQLVE